MLRTPLLLLEGHNTSKTADAVRGTALTAVIEAGRAIYNTGQDVAQGLAFLGFADNAVRSALPYIYGTEPELEYLSQSQHPEPEGMAPTAKRGRYVVPVGKPKVAPVVKKYVKQCMKKIVEPKYLVTSYAQTNIAATGTLRGDFLGAIVQGTTDGTRTGNYIRVKRIMIRGYFQDTVTGGVRAIVGWDHQSNGAVIANGEILASTGFNSDYNHDVVVGNGGARYKVLSDKRFLLEPRIAATNDQTLYRFEWRGDVPVHYDGNAGTVADVVSNNLVVGLFSINGTEDFTGEICICYTDN